MSIGTQYGTCYTDYYYQSFAIPDIAPGEIKFLVIGSYSSTNGGGQYWQDSTEYIQVKNPSGNDSGDEPEWRSDDECLDAI
jgi:hypothetical protein